MKRHSIVLSFVLILTLLAGCSWSKSTKPATPNWLDRQLLSITTNEVTVVKTNVVEAKQVFITNVVNQVVAVPNPVAKGVATIGATVAGDALGGWGGLLGAGLAAAFGAYARNRQKAFNASEERADKADDTSQALVQNIEVAKALIEELSKTPQGSEVATRYKNWMMKHQQEAGVIDAINDLVKFNPDSSVAKAIAAELAARK